MADYPNPYLVQRLKPKRERPAGSLDNLRFGEVFELDYMGAAEYEFGAFPKFLRRMASALLGRVTVTLKDGTKVFAVYDMASYTGDAQVAEVLNDIADKKTRHKCGPDFPPRVPTAKWDSGTVAWAELDHGLFWSLENMSVGVSKLFANSVKYMDAQKA